MEREALQLSLAIALRSVLVSLPVATLVAWLLTRVRFPGRTLLDAVVHLPLVLPPVRVGYLPLVGFGARGPAGPGNPLPWGPAPNTPPIGVQVGQDYHVFGMRSQFNS